MTLLVRSISGLLALLLCAGLSGCLPSGPERSDEEKEPYFLAGKSCINRMDYRGAIDEFQKALEVNPRSAAAHFQLGCLYSEKEPDPAAAIYHFERFLKLRPDAENVDLIQQLISNCKQDLARTSVLPLQVAPSVQQEIERLAAENKRLQEEVERWRAYYRSNPTNTTPAPTPLASRPAPPLNSTAGSVTSTYSTTTTVTGVRPPPTTARTHTVQTGETPYSIARRYGVSADKLLTANPGVDPRRLRVGQKLNIPSP